jgi:hypothetical protein
MQNTGTVRSRAPAEHYRVTARFDQGAGARKALNTLEMHGVDAGRISLADDTVVPESGSIQRASEKAVTHRVAARAGLGIFLGLILAALRAWSPGWFRAA